MTSPGVGEGGKQHLDRHELIRRHNSARLLEAVGRADGPVSRVALSDVTGLSKPTVGSLVDDLAASGLLREAGTRTGSVGRPASLVELNADAGYVLALAFDGDLISAAIADLGGGIRADAVTRLPKPERLLGGVNGLVDEILAQASIPASSVLAVCISAPGIVEQGSARRTLAQNVPGLDDDALFALMSSWFEAPVTIENDVNLAAIGEHRFGSAVGAASFVFLLVDTGVGMGLMLNGELYRGSRGAAGEAGYLPVGDLELTGRSARVGALEASAGIGGLLRRYRGERKRAGLSRARVDLDYLLRAVRLGEPQAVSAVDAEVDLVTRAVLAANVLVDPEFVVLAGRIGSCEPIIQRVRARLEMVAPYPVEVRDSALLGRAAIMGAVASGLDAARAEIGFPPH